MKIGGARFGYVSEINTYSHDQPYIVLEGSNFLVAKSVTLKIELLSAHTPILNFLI